MTSEPVSSGDWGAKALDLLADAWLNLSEPDDGDMANSDHMLLTGSVDDGWSREAHAVLREFAELNVRPRGGPWKDARFDAFGWVK